MSRTHRWVREIGPLGGVGETVARTAIRSAPGHGVGLGARTALGDALGHLLDDGLLALRRLAALDVGMRVLDDLACEGNQRESDTLGE